MSHDWQKTVTFSDRFASITRIQVALRASRPGRPSDDAQSEATLLEAQAWGLATSKEQYQAAVKHHVFAAESITLAGEALQEAEYDSDIDKLLPDGVDIGPYKNAVHYRDGLFSAVFKAHTAKSAPTVDDPIRKNRNVALKVTYPSAMTPPHNVKREGRLLKRAACKHVIPLTEVFAQPGGKLILAFPFMPYDLGKLLHNRNMSHGQKKACMADVFKGLKFIHQAGIIHRDIKPSNILLRTLSGPTYIADFGIAWAKDDVASEPYEEKILDVGTTSYRPPELLFGNQKYDYSLDVWSAGCVAAQLVSLGPEPLFDSGDLGSDLALIKSMFETLGTPTDETWPEAKKFHDWGKMTFHDYPAKPWAEILPGASDRAKDLVSSLIRFESSERLTASKALRHPFFDKDDEVNA